MGSQRVLPPRSPPGETHLPWLLSRTSFSGPRARRCGHGHVLSPLWQSLKGQGSSLEVILGAPDFRVPPGPSWFQMREGASPPPPGSLPVSIPKALSWKAWKSPTSSPDPMNSGFLGLVPPSPGRHKGPSLALRLQEAAEGFCPPSRQRHPSRCPCPAWGVSSWVRAVCPLPLQPRAKPGVSLARGGRVKALACVNLGDRVHPIALPRCDSVPRSQSPPSLALHPWA